MPSNESSKFESVPKHVDRSDHSTLRFHRVAPGETLTQIAEEYYGNKSFWILLYGSNDAGIRKAGGLRPGLTLYVPFL